MSSKLLEQMITCILERKLGDIVGSVSEHHSEESHKFYGYPEHKEVKFIYHTVAYQVCKSIVTERKNNVQTLI